MNANEIQLSISALIRKNNDLIDHCSFCKSHDQMKSAEFNSSKKNKQANTVVDFQCAKQKSQLTQFLFSKRHIVHRMLAEKLPSL